MREGVGHFRETKRSIMEEEEEEEVEEMKVWTEMHPRSWRG